MKTSGSIAVCIFSRSHLAGAYLAQLLSCNQLFTPILCEELPSTPPSQTMVFLFETSGGTFPLSRCVREIQSRFPLGRFVVVGDPKSEEDLVQLLQLGIHGYLEYSRASKLVLKTTLAVARGEFRMPQQILQKYIHVMSQPHANYSKSCFRVTRREFEVLELVRERLSNKEIAKCLNVKESTVKFHLSHILSKLQVSNRYDLHASVILDKSGRGRIEEVCGGQAR